MDQTTTPISSHQPIGVFDSGIGGLTVVAELRRRLPHEAIFYIGDTARVPYGNKSQATIERYSVEISELLLTRGAKMIVVACNTASSQALPQLEHLLPVPVTGVILPGAKAAVARTKNGHIGVIGTRATVRSGAYEKAIHALAPEVRVTSKACPMLVPTIEEGWLQSSITDAIIAEYLGDLTESGIDTLVLGCTHYPLLKKALARYLGPDIRLVDSGENCAIAVGELLETHRLSAPKEAQGSLQVALTDPADVFLTVAEEALGLSVGEIHTAQVQK